MDKKKSILNVGVSVFFKMITLVMSIVVRKFLVEYCGNEVNGLNALYLSIIGILAVAELGVGSAITFCMYKPIVEGDNAQVSALYRLFRRIYMIVAGVILVVGIGITPFIHLFAKDYSELDMNLYSTFIMMLISVVMTYLYSAKTSLINAYKNNYITTAITSAGILLQYVLQICALVWYGTFESYLLCRIIAVTAQWVITDIIAKKKYRSIMVDRQKIDYDTRFTLIRSIRAMFMHKVGTLLVNTVDSVVISFFVGVVALGEYSNYTTILTSITNIISLVFTSLISVVGHAYVENSKEKVRKYCEVFHLLNFVIGTVFYLGYYAVVDDIIAMLFGASLLVDRSVSFVITLNGFVQFMRRSVLLFREATGTFYNDRWKPLFEGIVNIVLSVIFVKYFGVTGVIMATIVTNIVICHVIEPYVIYINAFEYSPFGYYLSNYGMIAMFTAALFGLDYIMGQNDNHWISMLMNGGISVALSTVVCVAAAALNIRKLKDIGLLKERMHSTDGFGRKYHRTRV